MRKRKLKLKRPKCSRPGFLVLVLVLVPRYCRSCLYYRNCRRAGKPLLARVPADEQTLVPPVAAALVLCFEPSVRLAGTASTFYLCLPAFAKAAPQSGADIPVCAVERPCSCGLAVFHSGLHFNPTITRRGRRVY